MRTLIYLFPCLIDLALAAAFYVCTRRTADMKMSPLMVGALPAAWSGVYVAASLILGRLITEQKAAGLLLASCAVLTLAYPAFILFPSVNAMFALMIILAVGCALFFVSFQVFMKSVDQGRAKPIPWSTGIYTFSWSMGFSLGPFVGGFLWDAWDWKAPFVLNTIVAIGTGAAIFCIRHWGTDTPTPSPTSEATDTPSPSSQEGLPSYAGLPDFAWLGWLCSGIGILTVSLVRAMLASSTAHFSISSLHMGWILALVSLMQALTALALCRSRVWMYKPWPLFLFGAIGILGLAGLAFSNSTTLFLLSAIPFGIYCGSFYFYFVFHALVHPERSARYVGINEATVGAAGIVGPILGGQLGTACGLDVPSSPYLAAALLVMLAVVYQVIVHKRHTVTIDN